MGMSLLGAAHAQFSIHGKNIKLADGTKVYLLRSGVKVDSAIVSSESFDISHLQKVYPEYIFVATAQRDWQVAFWLSNDSVTIDGASNQITGAPEEDLYQAYRQYMEPAWKAEREVVLRQNEDLLKTGGKNYAYYQKLLNGRLLDSEDSLFLTFADRHPRAAICLNHIYNRRVLKKYTVQRYGALLAHLDTTAFGSKQWLTMKQIYEKDLKKEPGNKFPENIMGKDVYGVSYALNVYRGKYVTLVFGLPGLDDYTKGVAPLRTLYDKYKAKGYDELDFVFASAPKDIVKDCASAPRPWTVVSDYHAWFSPYSQGLAIDHVCQYFLISPDGTILIHSESVPDYVKAVENILK